MPPAVTQALDIARDSREGARDAVVRAILNEAIDLLWDEVMELWEDSDGAEVYWMSEEEFTLFNYFQNYFEGDKIAMLVRERFWMGDSFERYPARGRDI
ncbi:hypothetical protein QBC42DRAFT_237545 [Cladorrhinum samala]|uniref:Uncharacterized protein n=1 Tax=Cladorrhinum samala TaxID=585594 RepID=A0AAV9H879_9PEZI|nr:hypothetical protein QBC42DRAFT_237545 [Cladorrhinum samala]